MKTGPDDLPPDATLPVLPFAWHSRQKASHEDTGATRSVPAVPQASTPMPKEAPAGPATAASWRVLAIALAAWGWLLGTLIGAGRVARGFLVLRRFRRSLETPSLEQIDQASREAAKAFRIERLPPIRVSARAPAPLSLGLLHPIIVLPKDLVEESNAEQLRAILVHEAAHLVHHHHWIGLAQWLAGILFWWNPLSHRVNRGILRLREEICDDHVLQSRSDGREFARMLVDLAARLSDLPRVPATLAILETGYSDFQHRITNLLDKERNIVTRMTRKGLFSVALFGLAILFAVPLAGLRAEQKSNAVNAAISKAGPGSNDDGEMTHEFAQAEPYGNDSERLIGFFTFTWRMESVQKELHLTHQQEEQLTARRGPPEPAWSSPEKRTAQIQKSYQRLQAILLPKQLDRAREIALQVEGASAFFDADVIKALEITGDQRTEMQAIYRESMNAAWKAYPAAHTDPANVSNEQKRKLLEQADAIQKTILDKFLKLLSREQRAKYEKMIGKRIDREELLKEILDASLKARVAPAEKAPPKGIKADKNAAGTPKNAAAYAASAPLQRRETDSNAGIVAFFADWVHHFPSLQKELELTDEQREQLFPKLEAILPAGRTIAPPNATMVASVLKDIKATLLPRQYERARELAVQEAAESIFLLPESAKSLGLSRRQQEEIRVLCDDSKKEITEQINGFQKTARKHQPGTQELLEMLFSNSDACLKKVLARLTSEQRTQYEKMRGKAFDFKNILRDYDDAKEARLEMQKVAAAPEAAYSKHNQSLPENVLSSEAAAAIKVLRAGPPADEKDRIAAAIVVIRSCNMGQENDYPKENALRELIRIGKPAVPRLIEELDRTTSDGVLRALGFVLRGIGDPRAVPALIRAIPRLARPTGSDCGYTINNDPELLKFMQENDNTNGSPFREAGAKKYPGQATLFTYGRPINEIMPALQKTTGENHRWIELVFTQIGNSAEHNRLKRLEFQELAARWAEWWEKNWRKFVKDEGEAQVEPTRRVLAKYAEDLAKLAPQPLREIPCGKNVDLGDGNNSPFIVSFDDPRMLFRLLACIDLDTGRMPLAPQELVKNSSTGNPSPDLLSWAEKEGVHLIGMKFRPQGSEKSYYAFQPVGMKVWRIDNRRYDNLAKELQKVDKLDLPGLWEGPIASLNEKTGQVDEYQPASFLFLTKRGSCGAIRVQSKETYAMPKEGTPAYGIGSPFELRFIYRNEKGQ